MKKVSFKSGVHPFEGKKFSENEKIVKIDSAEIMVFPMNQHIGAPALPIVKAGDRVLKGMKIAEASSAVSSPVYSSVSGKVKSIEPRRLANGTMSQSIVVENDFSDECEPGFGEVRNPNEIPTDELVKIISESGIVGLGGAGFPTGVKLTPKNAEHIDYLIINGAECEPYLTSDYRIMLEKAGNILMGVSIALRLFKQANAVIAIEDNKKSAVDLFEEQCKSIDKISVLPLKTRYPQGAERRLIASVTGRMINSHMLPADAGVIVLNVSTVYAIYEAVCCSIPLIHRIVTVTGDGVNHPCNADVPLGIPASFLMEKCGGIKENTVKIISGGPMMGAAMENLEAPVTKTFSSVLAFTSDDVADMKTTACIKCGRCVNVCPEKLVPQLMAHAANAGDFERFEKLNGMECIECGCCTYVCPAKRPLTQSFKLAKASVRAAKKV
ncbi:MAG: electron transport complex subunit RsxC [Clostridiales bacterium]|nr:electron transport complex subunit RsxC [Clostridiales bacterium]